MAGLDVLIRTARLGLRLALGHVRLQRGLQPVFAGGIFGGRLAARRGGIGCGFVCHATLLTAAQFSVQRGLAPRARVG